MGRPQRSERPTVYANIHELRTQFDTQNGEGPVHSGVFDGSILANSIGQPIERGFEIGTPGISQIEIQGDLAAVLAFSAPVVPDQTFDGPQIVVGGDFLATSIIQLPENGLVGQIILNRDDEDGIWQTTPPNGAKVNVGDPNGPGPSYSITGPSYGFTATSLGGGAAGHAAFRVHRQSSIPPLSQFFPVEHFAYGELRLDEGGLGWECVFDAPIIVQFYGPVGITPLPVPPPEGPPQPMKIERREGLLWVDRSTGFEFVPSFDGDAKRMLIRPLGDWEAGSYRIQRKPGRLHCQDVAVGATDVARFLFYIDVTLVPCENKLLMGFDLNADDAVMTPGDLPVLLVEQVDLSGDAVTDTDDVTLLQSAAALYAQPSPQVIFYEGPWDDIELP